MGGVIMFEMMNGIVLFDGEREQDLFRNILHQPIELPKTMSKPAQDIVLKFLKRTPKDRLGKREVKPPFVPRVKNVKDTANFDSEFTACTPTVTPTAASELALINQELFQGFTFEYHAGAVAV